MKIYKKIKSNHYQSLHYKSNDLIFIQLIDSLNFYKLFCFKSFDIILFGLKI